MAVSLAIAFGIPDPIPPVPKGLLLLTVHQRTNEMLRFGKRTSFEKKRNSGCKSAMSIHPVHCLNLILQMSLLPDARILQDTSSTLAFLQYRNRRRERIERTHIKVAAVHASIA
jgi:hypothetical protein